MARERERVISVGVPPAWVDAKSTSLEQPLFVFGIYVTLDEYLSWNNYKYLYNYYGRIEKVEMQMFSVSSDPLK